MILRKLLPSITYLKEQRGFAKIGDLAEKKPYLFVMKRHNVALGFSIGLAWGAIPLPIQVFASLFTCYIFKANIPAAILAAIITNPITYPFILAISYFLGSFFVITDKLIGVIPPFSLLIQSPLTWIDKSADYLSSMGETLLIGIPITAALLGILGYWFVSLSWIYSVLHKRKSDLAKRKKINLKENNPMLTSQEDITIS